MEFCSRNSKHLRILPPPHPLTRISNLPKLSTERKRKRKEVEKSYEPFFLFSSWSKPAVKPTCVRKASGDGVEMLPIASLFYLFFPNIGGPYLQSLSIDRHPRKERGRGGYKWSFMGLESLRVQQKQYHFIWSRLKGSQCKGFDRFALVLYKGSQLFRRYGERKHFCFSNSGLFNKELQF